MRTIKFRAWYPKKKKWLKDFAIDCDANSLTTIEHNDLSIEDGEVILMQFTGLYDKNKREIYDGDILLSKNSVKREVHYSETSMEWFAAVPNSQYEAFPLGHWKIHGNDTIEVIGNIYEK